jgi:hypothetical protein
MKECINVSRNEEILTSKMPVSFYIVTVSLIALLAFFLALALIGRLDWPAAAFCFLLFGGMIYGCLGRYLAKIVLSKDRIEINYIFPWNRPILFEFRSLATLDIDEKPSMLSLLSYIRDYAWYRQYSKLYLENEEGRNCGIKYNIDSAYNKRLLNELRKSLQPKSRSCILNTQNPNIF